MRKIPITITEEELIKILTTHKIKKNHKTAFMLSFYLQLRVSEIVKLNIENVDKGKHIVHILQGKGSKDRDVCIYKPLLLSSKTIFQALDRLPVGCGIRSLQKAFKRYAKKVLDKDLHYHCLRHSGATWLLNKKKLDIRKVQQQLGHSKLATTEIYCHVGAKDLVEMEWGDE